MSITIFFTLIMKELEPDRYIVLPISTTDIGLSHIYLYQRICSHISPDTNVFFKAGKNAWTGNLKLCSFIVCPAEGGTLFND